VGGIGQLHVSPTANDDDKLVRGLVPDIIRKSGREPDVRPARCLRRTPRGSDAFLNFMDSLGMRMGSPNLWCAGPVTTSPAGSGVSKACGV